MGLWTSILPQPRFWELGERISTQFSQVLRLSLTTVKINAECLMLIYLLGALDAFHRPNILRILTPSAPFPPDCLRDVSAPRTPFHVILMACNPWCRPPTNEKICSSLFCSRHFRGRRKQDKWHWSHSLVRGRRQDPALGEPEETQRLWLLAGQTLVSLIYFCFDLKLIVSPSPSHWHFHKFWLLFDLQALYWHSIYLRSNFIEKKNTYPHTRFNHFIGRYMHAFQVQFYFAFFTCTNIYEKLLTYEFY